ncbi:hypothetical protein RE93_14265 [Klebsiella pneumoniae]|nr:hypothetical protein LQ47_08520 [Klebsiella pneumoniae]AOM92006.1 hypothetical protein AM275_21640 [Klebsiella pneumoniae]KMK49149.1 hypothetical protein ABW15_04950 [Klebsiella pneumoniae]OCR51808.1 hypothetical protein QH74_14855 [Klebsiella pneumoniae]OCR61799.1 hypothetical protein QH75_11165 [Klebsiella pneumoniae]
MESIGIINHNRFTIFHDRISIIICFLNLLLRFSSFFINNDNLIWTCKLKCRLDTIIDIVIFNFFNRCIENIDTFALQCRIREFIKPQYCIKCLTVK